MSTASNNTNILLQLISKIRKKRFAFLTKSIILLIIIYPYVQGNVFEQVLLSLLTTIVMILSIIAVADKRSHSIIAILLALPWFLIILSKFPIIPVDTKMLFKEEIVSALLLFAYTTYRIFIHIIKSREVTTEILFASISVYLLIGLTWATLYILINTFHPGSFIDTDGRAIKDGPDLLFFSYVTLTTVGYGNIEAISNPARSFATIEALSGQLYLAIMVARLVGLHISKSKADD